MASVHGRTLVFLHLAPGVLQMAMYMVLAPPLLARGVPRALIFGAAVLLTSVPFMLAVMATAGRRPPGRLWADGVVGFRRSMPFLRYVAVCLPLLGLAFGLLALLAPVAGFLEERLFHWLPAFLSPSWEPPVAPDRSLTLLALWLQLAVDGIVAPTIEELYFRGFLLPRMWALRGWAPAANAALFTAQHLWQPFNWPLIFLMVLPEAYVVWWTRNVRISVLLHCTANTLGAALALVAHAG